MGSLGILYLTEKPCGRNKDPGELRDSAPGPSKVKTTRCANQSNPCRFRKLDPVATGPHANPNLNQHGKIIPERDIDNIVVMECVLCWKRDRPPSGHGSG